MDFRQIWSHWPTGAVNLRPLKNSLIKIRHVIRVVVVSRAGAAPRHQEARDEADDQRANHRRSHGHRKLLGGVVRPVDRGQARDERKAAAKVAGPFVVWYGVLELDRVLVVGVAAMGGIVAAICVASFLEKMKTDPGFFWKFFILWHNGLISPDIFMVSFIKNHTQVWCK